MVRSASYVLVFSMSAWGAHSAQLSSEPLGGIRQRRCHVLTLVVGDHGGWHAPVYTFLARVLASQAASDAVEAEALDRLSCHLIIHWIAQNALASGRLRRQAAGGVRGEGRRASAAGAVAAALDRRALRRPPRARQARGNVSWGYTAREHASTVADARGTRVPAVGEPHRPREARAGTRSAATSAWGLLLVSTGRSLLVSTGRYSILACRRKNPQTGIRLSVVRRSVPRGRRPRA